MARLRTTMAITIGVWMMTVSMASAQVGAPSDPPAQAAAPSQPRRTAPAAESSPAARPTAPLLTPAAGYVSGTNLNADTDSVNNGTYSPGLILGGAFSGESIASRRTAGAGQFGISVFTNSLPRLTISGASNGRSNS